MAVRKHLIHLKSRVAENNQPKAPLAEDLNYGEIAINYLDGKERIFIKNSSDEIVGFYPSTYIDENFYSTTYIDEVEEVTAQALADTDVRINNTNSEVSRITTLLNDEVDRLDDKIDDEIDRVDTRIDEAQKYAESITYSELKTKRDDGELVPGRFYRITDYVTTTTQTYTRSANNQFDIIVLALDENTLSENAQATQHEGDTYFANCKLSAWKLKYRLDNDVNNFIWADSTNGKGVIYYMKDEWDNECPYDFKNIQFRRCAITETTLTNLDLDITGKLISSFKFSDNGGKHYAVKTLQGNWIPTSAGVNFTVNEDMNAWYYTFNGLSSTDGTTIDESYDMSVTHFELSQQCISWMSSNNAHEYYKDICRNNVILPHYDETDSPKVILNNIVFNNGMSYCYFDSTENKWMFSTAQCSFNRFGYGCRDMTFGSDTYANLFGELTCNNYFGNDIKYNSFDDNIDGNVFCGNSFENKIGRGFGFNTVGDGVSRNTIGHTNFSNVYGNNARFNIIGNDFRNNILHTEVWYNIFGNGCSHNNIAEKCWNNTFGNSVKYVVFQTPYCFFNIVENGNSFITLTTTQTPDATNTVRNVRIAQGTNYGNVESDRKTITHDRLNQTSCTVYQNANSNVVNV